MATVQAMRVSREIALRCPFIHPHFEGDESALCKEAD